MNKRMRGSFESDDVFVGGIPHRLCRFCGEVKPLDEFPRNGLNDDGSPAYRQDCRVCYNIRRKENATKKKHTDFIGSMKRRGEAVVGYTHEEWKQTVIFFHGRCAYCQRTMKKGERLTRDHLVPVVEGGLTTQENIVPCCSSCNSSKGKTEWREWYLRQPFFSQDAMNRIFEWRSIIRAAGNGGRSDE